MTDGDNYDPPPNLLTRSDSRTESTISDSDSSVAPTDFQLSESFECSTQGAAVSVALERCWLCLGSRRSFHCKQCVRAGDFVHSRPLQLPFQPLRPLGDLERYADKQKRWMLLKEERDRLVERFHSSLARPLHVGQKKTNVELRRQRIELMKAAHSRLNAVVEIGQQQLNGLLARTSSGEVKLVQCENYLQKLRADLAERAVRIQRHMEQYNDIISELTRLRQQHISDLITYIFPISELPARSESSSAVDDEQQNTVRLLADARCMAYIKGQWVYTDTGCELLYRIVSPTLPGNGDYSVAMVDSKEPSGRGSETSLPLELNPLQTITAALSLTAQLVSVLACYLDVILPQRLDYSEFYVSELTEQSFNRAVLRLNHNILRLCFTQAGISVVGINPRHTIVNLLMVLSSPDLGKEGCDIIDDEETVALMRSVESSLLGAPVTSDEETSEHVCPTDSESTASDVDELSDLAVGLLATAEQVGGWEHVSLSLPEVDMSRTSSPSYFADSQAATVTSLMSSAASAATSALSFWRGWNRGSDNR